MATLGVCFSVIGKTISHLKASKQRYEREACETIGGGQSTTAVHTAQDLERR
jgi:hypothetical protein